MELELGLPPEKKQPRKRAKKSAAVGKQMYTMDIVGAIGIDGYDLKPGEKLVVVKLSPLAIGK